MSVQNSVNNRYDKYATLLVGASGALNTNTYNYDYVCDGTADNVEIQAAIDALASTGGRVVLSEGTFNIAATLTIAKDNVVLEGQGKSTKIFLVNATNVNMITIGSGATAYTDIVVSNVYMDGNKANQTTNGHGIQVENGVTSGVIKNCRIFSTFKNNINIGTSTNIKILYNYLDTTGASSYNIKCSGTGCIAKGNTCIGGTAANILFDSSTQPGKNIVTNNVCTSSSGEGILGQSWQMVISNNHISEFAFEGITVTTPSEISGNSIYQRNGAGNIGIYLSSSDPQHCTGNVIFVYDNVTFAFTGIYCQTASSIISGNSIQMESTITPAHVGVLVGADKVSVCGNTITQYQFTGTGIIRSGGHSYINVSGNVITGFDTGIDMNHFAYSTCSSNSINCNNGIIATDSVNCVIADNSIYANTISGTQRGIYVNNAAAQTITITGNSIYRAAVEGIYLSKVTKSIICNNKIYNGSQQTSSAGILLTGTSTYNIVSGNSVHASSTIYTYGISEASSADGPNVITNNILLNWSTAAILAQHAATDVSHNITS